jgi:peroxygenase
MPSLGNDHSNMSDSPTLSETTDVNLPAENGASHDPTQTKLLDTIVDVQEQPWLTSIPQQPQTEDRKPFITGQNDVLTNAGTARATIAASRESPNGTIENDYAAKHQNEVVLQQHCEYFDRDRDGIIWPQDTYIGFRKWGMYRNQVYARGFLTRYSPGWNPLLAGLATFIINFNLSYPTCPSILPDPFFRIYVKRVYKNKHGSDSMTYDNEGRFRPQNFEDIFAKYDRENKGGLSLKDVTYFWKGQRMVFDFFGWSATILECE